MKKQYLRIKLVVVGDVNVGKTSLLKSYTQQAYEYGSICFDNYSSLVRIDDKMVQLGLWDTSGQQQYHRLRPLAYFNCDIFLIVFSVVDPSSFVNAIERWYPQLQENVGNIPIIFVGNNIDLRDEFTILKKDSMQRPIMKETAQKIIEDQFQSKYLECSARTKEGLNSIFDQAMRIVIQKKSQSVLQERQQSSSCLLI